MHLSITLSLLSLIGGQPEMRVTNTSIRGNLAPSPHELVRLHAEGLPPRAALKWAISGPGRVYRATTARDRCEWSAEPGTYDVTLLVVTVQGDTPELEELAVRVVVPGCTAPPAKPPAPQPPSTDRVAPAKAVVRIQFGSAGCSAVAVHPRRPDGRYDILTAAHCIGSVGQRGTLFDNEGKKIPVTCLDIDRTSDHAWLVTDDAAPSLWCARLADSDPAVGAPVWHAGFGIDRPGNVEVGKVAMTSNRDGQVQYRLSVSSGDSGGPIYRESDGRILGVVCCTTERGRMADVWAAGPVVMTASRPAATRAKSDGWTPSEMPLRGEKHGAVEDTAEWRARSIPLISK